ncbi:hypothetical protein ABQG68_16655 [Bacillus pumilus]|uniref:hypothetical protein n=1 Tax=Bacillus pumilus TaxID=1408 RepID=UPI003315E60B
MMEWYTWVFSGIGVFALTFLTSKQMSKSKKVKQKQIGGENSNNYQSFGSMTINAPRKED